MDFFHESTLRVMITVYYSLFEQNWKMLEIAAAPVTLGITPGRQGMPTAGVRGTSAVLLAGLYWAPWLPRFFTQLLTKGMAKKYQPLILVVIPYFNCHHPLSPSLSPSISICQDEEAAARNKYSKSIL